MGGLFLDPLSEARSKIGTGWPPVPSEQSKVTERKYTLVCVVAEILGNLSTIFWRRGPASNPQL
jgi:hypothetical protein